MRIEAEAFSLVSGFTLANNGVASGGQMIQSNSPSTTARADYIFGGAAGVYSLTLGHFDENDGTASMSVLVNGVAVNAFLWDKQLGTANANANSLTQQVFGNVALQAGDVVSLVGRSTAGEPLRTDYLDIDFVSAPDATERAPQNTAPTTIGATITAPVTFTGANQISVADLDGDALTTVVSVTSGTLAVGAGSGAAVLSYAPNTVTLSGSAAQVNAALSGLVFTPGGTGTTTMTIQTSDGSLTDTDQVAINVAGFGNANADIGIRSLDPGFFENRLHFSHIDIPNTNGPSNLSMKASATVRVSSTGTEPLVLSGAELTGPFTLANPNQLNGVTLQPGQFIDVTVLFNRAAFVERVNNVSSVFTGELRINSNDLEDNSIVVELAGNWQRRDESSWEPNINEIWETFGFGNNIPGLPFVDSDPSPLNNLGVYEAYNQYEVLSPYWKIADGFTQASVTHIAQYAGRGTAELGIHRPFNKGIEAVQLVAANGGSQRILPTSTTNSTTYVGADGALVRPFSSATFTNVTIPDNWQGDDIFGIHLANFSTDPTLNNIGTGAELTNLAPGTVLGHWMRMFQALDKNGVVIPNVYLGVQDFSGSNGDYNDNLLIIRGVAPASNAPVNTAPSTVSVQGGSTLAFSGANQITVSDVDGAALTTKVTVWLSAENGVLTIAAPGSATVTGNGTGLVSITTAVTTASLSQVNTALAGLVYTPNAGFTGEDTLKITSLDGALTAKSQVAITVSPIDFAPTVTSATVDAIAVGAATTTLTVVYADTGLNAGIDLATIDPADIIVTGPGGQALTVTGVSISGSGATRTVTYTIAAPGGAWDLADNGAYTIALKANEVRDINGNAVAANPTLASFDVAIALPETVRIEAESMTRTSGFSVNSLFSASAGQLIQGNGSGEQRATHTFTGPSGVYDLNLFYWDENDGVSQLSILVNGVAVDSFLWDKQLGSPNANGATRTSNLTSNITLQPGDTITFVGFTNGGESLRIDAFDLIYKAAPTPVDTAPTVTSATLGAITAGAATTTLTVVYADTGLNAGINAATIDASDLTVTGPGGQTLTVTGASVSGSDATRTVVYTIAAPGGVWDAADNGAYTVALKAGEVRDIGGNAVAANPSLASFNVALAGDSAPTVTSATLGAITAGAASTTLTVVYADSGLNAGINAATIDVNDLTVTGPGGQALTVTGASVSGSDATRTVVYTIAAPGGVWDAADNGAYTVALKAGEVRDIGGQAVAANPALAGFNVAISTPDPIRVEVESMALQNLSLNANVNSSGGLRVQASGSGESTATHVFTGPSGVYDLRLFYWDENDGVANLAIRVNGVAVDSFLWDQDLGNANANPSTYTSRLTAGVELRTGDVIVLAGSQNAGEPLRMDALDFIFKSALAPVDNTPSVFSASVGAITTGAATTTLTVVYADSGFNAGINAATIDASDLTVTGPGGQTLAVTGVSLSGGGFTQTATYTIAAPGGTWDAADNGAYTVALKANEVRDISGNAVAANPALAAFNVAIQAAVPDPVRVEVENMTLQNLSVNANANASGGLRVQADGSGESSATHVFTGPNGIYDLDLFYWDENDGVSNLSIRVNGVIADSFLWDKQLGSANANPATYTSHETAGLELRTGDIIALVGNQNGGEPLRMDALDFIFVDNLLG